MKKRLLSAVLALALCFGFPASVTRATERSNKAGVEQAGMFADELGSSVCIFVNGENLRSVYGAENVVESGGITLLSYESMAAAKTAEKKLIADGYAVVEDPELEFDASSYTYTPDILGQYGKTVQESTHTNAMTLAPELMGLTASARNIVDAQLTTTIKPVGVAVIDSGVDTSVGMLSGRVRGGYNVVNGNSSTGDEYGHGTFIASEIVNNTPSNVSIIPIKVSDETGAFTASRLAAALQYLVSNSAGVNVVNLSLSLCTLDRTQMDQVEAFINPYIDALYERGIVIVTSAGNKNANYPTMTANDSYPANYAKCVAVGALGYGSGSWGAYSQSLQGSCIDYWAPGKLIRGAKAVNMRLKQATAATNWSGEWLDLGDGTCIMSGTSQATAFVSAALAQILSYDTALSANDQLALLRANSASCASGYYPEMSGYFYAVGSFNSSTGGYSGLIADWDVVVDTSAGTITLVKYTGNSESVVVPATYKVNGRTLKTVLGKSTAASGPFANNDRIKSVTVTDGVSVQDNDASYMFYGCKKLQTMSRIPDDVINTSYMFYGCSSLLQYPAVPAKVTTMNDMFYGCGNVSGTSKIESALVTSAKDAYAGCAASLEVPLNSVTFNTFKSLVEQWEKVSLSGYKPDTTIGNGDDKTGSGASGSTATGAAVKGSYNVTFYYRNASVNKVSGGKVVKTKSDSRGFVTKPKNPAKSGYYFAGWYEKTGTVLKKFSFTDTQITNDTKLYAKWISKKIGATQIKSVKKTDNKEFWISCSKASNATYYQIQVSSHKNFQSGPVIRTKGTGKTVTMLTGGKKYVRVRGCRKIGGKWYYGKWSVVKTVSV